MYKIDNELHQDIEGVSTDDENEPDLLDRDDLEAAESGLDSSSHRLRTRSWLAMLAGAGWPGQSNEDD